jgi:hypothetical protein
MKEKAPSCAVLGPRPCGGTAKVFFFLFYLDLRVTFLLLHDDNCQNGTIKLDLGSKITSMRSSYTVYGYFFTRKNSE